MRIQRLLLGLVIGSFCFYYAFQEISLDDFKKNLKNIDFIWLSIASMGIFFSQWFRATRWRRLLKPIQLITLAQSFQIYSIGNLINLLIPLRGGDLIRAWLVARQTSAKASACLATVVSERLIDLIIFASILGISLLIYPLPKWIIWMGGCLLISCLSLIYIFILLKTKTLRLTNIWNLLRKKISHERVEKISQAVEHFLEGIIPFESKQEYNKFMIETGLVWVFQGLFIYFLFKAIGLNPAYHLEVSATLLMLALTTVAVTIPSSPSYAGTLHLMSFLALQICGVSASRSFTYSIIFHGHSTLISLLLGLYGLIKQRSYLSLKFFSQKKER